MRWRFRSRLKSSLYQAATRVWPRVAAFWHLFVGVLPATTCRWLLHLDCLRSTELNGRYSATKSTAEISVSGQVRTTAVTFRRSRPKRQTRRSGFVSVLLRLRFLAPAKSESEKAET